MDHIPEDVNIEGRVTRARRKRLVSNESDASSRPSTPVQPTKMNTIQENLPKRITRRNSVTTTPSKTPSKTPFKVNDTELNDSKSTPSRITRRRSISSQYDEAGLLAQTSHKLSQLNPLQEEETKENTKTTKTSIKKSEEITKPSVENTALNVKRKLIVDIKTAKIDDEVESDIEIIDYVDGNKGESQQKEKNSSLPQTKLNNSQQHESKEESIDSVDPTTPPPIVIVDDLDNENDSILHTTSDKMEKNSSVEEEHMKSVSFGNNSFQKENKLTYPKTPCLRVKNIRLSERISKYDNEFENEETEKMSPNRSQNKLVGYSTPIVTKETNADSSKEILTTPSPEKLLRSGKKYGESPTNENSMNHSTGSHDELQNDLSSKKTNKQNSSLIKVVDEENDKDSSKKKLETSIKNSNKKSPKISPKSQDGIKRLSTNLNNELSETEVIGKDSLINDSKDDETEKEQENESLKESQEENKGEIKEKTPGTFAISWTQSVVLQSEKIDSINKSATEEAIVEISCTETPPKTKKKLSKQKSFEGSDDFCLLVDDDDEEDEENTASGNETKNYFVDNEAECAGYDYESGDSMDSEEKADYKENDLNFEDGESIGSQDTTENEEEHPDEHDSFIASSDEDECVAFEYSDDDEHLKDKTSKKKYKRLINTGSESEEENQGGDEEPQQHIQGDDSSKSLHLSKEKNESETSDTKVEESSNTPNRRHSRNSSFGKKENENESVGQETQNFSESEIEKENENIELETQNEQELDKSLKTTKRRRSKSLGKPDNYDSVEIDCEIVKDTSEKDNVRHSKNFVSLHTTEQEHNSFSENQTRRRSEIGAEQQETIDTDLIEQSSMDNQENLVFNEVVKMEDQSMSEKEIPENKTENLETTLLLTNTNNSNEEINTEELEDETSNLNEQEVNDFLHNRKRRRSKVFEELEQNISIENKPPSKKGKYRHSINTDSQDDSITHSPLIQKGRRSKIAVEQQEANQEISVADESVYIDEVSSSEKEMSANESEEQEEEADVNVKDLFVQEEENVEELIDHPYSNSSSPTTSETKDTNEEIEIRALIDATENKKITKSNRRSLQVQQQAAKQQISKRLSLYDLNESYKKKEVSSSFIECLNERKEKQKNKKPELSVSFCAVASTNEKMDNSMESDDKLPISNENVQNQDIEKAGINSSIVVDNENSKSVGGKNTNNVCHILERCNKILEEANQQKLALKQQQKMKSTKVSFTPIVATDEENISKKRIALTRAFEASQNILTSKLSKKHRVLSNPQSRTQVNDQLSSKRLPAELLETVSPPSNRCTSRKRKREENSCVFKTSAGVVVEEKLFCPMKKPIEVLKTSAGNVIVEASSPVPNKKKFGFRESPITPKTNWRIQELNKANSQNEVFIAAQKQKNRRKRPLFSQEPTVAEPTYSLRKASWFMHQTGPVKVEKIVTNVDDSDLKLSSCESGAGSRTRKFGKTSSSDAGARAENFLQSAIYRDISKREDSRNILRRKKFVQ